MKLVKQKLRLTLKAALLKRLCRKRPAFWGSTEFQTILIMRYDRIGDMVVTTPLIRELRKLFPSATIDVLATKKNSAVLNENKNVSSILLYPESIIGKLVLLLRARGIYDLVIDLNHSLVWQALLELRILKPKAIIAPKKGPRYGVDPRDLSLYDRLSEMPIDRPLAEVYLNLLKLLDGGSSAIPSLGYDVPIGQTHQCYALRALDGLEAPFYGVNISGGRPSMSLQGGDLVRIVEVLLRKTEKGTVLLFSDPNSFDKLNSIFQESLMSSPRVLMLKPTTSVMDAVAVIEHLSILITPDTSLVHFACAKKIPLVAIYANEQALFSHWQPVSEAPWQVCFSKDNKSLNGYDIEEILENVNQLLELTSCKHI
jgi:ADP-heptose:LPS heptosyltransferase